MKRLASFESVAQRLLKRKRGHLSIPRRAPAHPAPSARPAYIAPENANWREWVSATATRNYMMNDPLCDWLSENSRDLVSKNPHMTSASASASRVSRSRNNFSQYIMSQGVEFEQKVVAKIYQKLGKDMIVQIGGELNAKSPEKVIETRDAMLKGVPVIHGGLLHNPQNKTFGVPDLLVRSDWVGKLVDEDPVEEAERKMPAVGLRGVWTKPFPKYHYVVVDIKFSTLALRADATHLLSSGSIPAYKSQLWIYNEALGIMQGYVPNKAYILGRRWKYTISGKTHKGKGCLEKLGVINYKTIDVDYIAKTRKAIAWLRDVRSEEAKSWDITKLPLPRKELYPNMSNGNDYPWRPLKDKIATEIKEVTSLWMVGVKHREIVHGKGILSWDDPKCDINTLGVTGEFTRKTLDAILAINKPTTTGRPRVNKIQPVFIENDFSGWQKQDTIEFYVDFETVGDVVAECLNTATDGEGASVIFMIGVGYMNPQTDTWVFQDFTADSLTFESEAQICALAANYIRQEAEIYGVKKPKCVHWAPAEQIHWRSAVQRHASSKDWKTEEWEWFDLLKIFKQEPIVIEGCLGFGLKDVAKTMQRLGCIDTVWDTSGACLDGQGAMIGAWNCHLQATSQGCSMKDLPEMREIRRYNEVDVKVLQEIITYIRLFHTERGIKSLLE